MRDTSVPTTTIWERLAVPLTGVSAAAFAGLSAIRRNQVFHPVGEAYSGTVTIAPGNSAMPGLDVLSGEHEAIVRFSRGAGVPEPMPDVLGIAIKIRPPSLPVEQDLLLASCGQAPVTRNLLVPARSFFRCMYSSVLPYRSGDEQLMFGAKADESLSRETGDFGDLQRAAREETLRFDLMVARLTGTWIGIGELVVGDPQPQQLSQELRFNPWNTQVDLFPAGPLNTIRRSTYEASQAARPNT